VFWLHDNEDKFNENPRPQRDFYDLREVVGETAGEVVRVVKVVLQRLHSTGTLVPVVPSSNASSACGQVERGAIGVGALAHLGEINSARRAM
jgi:hypothetical protein